MMTGCSPSVAVWAVLCLAGAGAVIAACLGAVRETVTGEQPRAILAAACKLFGFSAAVLAAIFAVVVLAGAS